MCRGVYDVLKSSYTLETFVYQLVTCKKCKMAVKVHTLIYKGADGVGANITLMSVNPKLEVCKPVSAGHTQTLNASTKRKH